MKYRKLGRTGWEVSAVSMGCWGIGGQWGPVGERQAIETIHAAIDAGVNLLDTADVYGMGVSEGFVGKAVKGIRDKLFIASKAGNWGRRQGDPMGLKSVYGIVNCCDASLYRLGIDTIDLYQCHVANPESPEIFVEAFERLKEQGKIREYGISTNSVGSLVALDAEGGCATCQMTYSLLDRSPEKDILPHCLEHNIGVLLKGPLSKGILADKFSDKTVFEDSVRAPRWNADGTDRKSFLKLLATVERLRPLVPDGASMVDLALAFVLANPAVTCPIPGMKNPEQARMNAAAAGLELDADVVARIDEIAPIQ